MSMPAGITACTHKVLKVKTPLGRSE